MHLRLANKMIFQIARISQSVPDITEAVADTSVVEVVDTPPVTTIILQATLTVVTTATTITTLTARPIRQQAIHPAITIHLTRATAPIPPALQDRQMRNQTIIGITDRVINRKDYSDAGVSYFCAASFALSLCFSKLGTAIARRITKKQRARSGMKALLISAGQKSARKHASG